MYLLYTDELHQVFGIGFPADTRSQDVIERDPGVGILLREVVIADIIEVLNRIIDHGIIMCGHHAADIIP